MTQIHHAIDYIELAAPDLVASRAFYTEVFSWSFNDYGPGYAGIRSLDDDGEVGGLNAGAVAGSGWPLVVIYSDDLDRTARSVENAGGRVADGPYAFPGGHRFHFVDPGGNELAVWTRAES